MESGIKIIKLRQIAGRAGVAGWYLFGDLRIVELAQPRKHRRRIQFFHGGAKRRIGRALRQSVISLRVHQLTKGEGSSEPERRHQALFIRPHSISMCR